MSHVPIKEIMTREVVAVPATMPVQEVAALLHRHHITGAPVVDDQGHVLGMVSEIDLLSRPGGTAGVVMSPQVISVTEETDVDEVARIFVNERVRRVPVLSGGRLAGIVSRGDLLHTTTMDRIRAALDALQASPEAIRMPDVVQQASEDSFPASDSPAWTQRRTAQIKEIMTREVVAVPPTMPVREVAALLQEKGISGVPVVDEQGHVLGIVSEFDLLSRPGATAAEIMSPEVVGVSEDTDIDEVTQLFIDQRIRRMPVLADGRLVGVISRADLLRARAG